MVVRQLHLRIQHQVYNSINDTSAQLLATVTISHSALPQRFRFILRLGTMEVALPFIVAINLGSVFSKSRDHRLGGAIHTITLIAVHIVARTLHRTLSRRCPWFKTQVAELRVARLSTAVTNQIVDSG